MFCQDVFPCTAEKFFNLLLNDDSNFTSEYRSARKDTNLTVSTKTAYTACTYWIALFSNMHKSTVNIREQFENHASCWFHLQPKCFLYFNLGR